MDLIVDLITPFDENLKINNLKFKNLIEELIKVDCKDIAFFGVTGECFTLSFDEIKNTYLEVIKQFKEFINVYIFLKYESLFLLKEHLDFFNEENLKIIIELPNSSFLEDGILDFFNFLEHGNKNELYLYYDEDFNKNIFSKSLFQSLMRINLIKGIFINLRDENKLLELKKDINKKIYLFNDTKMISALTNEFDGLLSPNSNIYYEKIKSLIYLKDFEILEQYQEKFKVAYLKPIPIIIKLAMNESNQNVGKVRLPLKELHFLEYECYLNKYK